MPLLDARIATPHYLRRAARHQVFSGSCYRRYRTAWMTLLACGIRHHTLYGEFNVNGSERSYVAVGTRTVGYAARLTGAADEHSGGTIGSGIYCGIERATPRIALQKVTRAS